jgi:putative FmdB family regulatory protein
VPTYEYIADESGCEYCSQGFEIRQNIRERALKECPKCGAPIRKVLSTCNHYSPSPSFSYDRAADAGFTAYERGSEGLKKIAGDGPDDPSTSIDGLP